MVREDSSGSDIAVLAATDDEEEDEGMVQCFFKDLLPGGARHQCPSRSSRPDVKTVFWFIYLLYASEI